MATHIKQRHIACFLAVIREGSLIAASNKLAMTAPAVSKTLSDLERVVGARLMERSRQGVSLTENGKIFLRYATASAAALDEAVGRIARNRTSARQAVSIGAMPNTLTRLLPAAVKQFKNVRAQVQVNIISGTNQGLTQLLREGELDFLIGRLPALEHMYSLNFEPLFTEELLPVVRLGHPLLRGEDPCALVKRLNDHTVIFPGRGTVVWADAYQLLAAAGCGEPADIIESLSMEFSRNYTLITDAVWITPRGTVQTEILNGSLHILPLDVSSARGTTGITSRRDIPLSALANELISQIRVEARTY